MARATGFEASVVLLAGRNEYVFSEKLLDMRQFNSDVVLVRADGHDYFLDPGAPFAPFGLLTWAEMGVRGMKLTKDGPEWVTTPTPDNSQAVIERKATFALDNYGNVSGEVHVSFMGLEALRLRQEALSEDDAGRSKLIEDRLKEWLPPGAKIELSTISGWQETESPLSVKCKIMAPSVAIPTGRRLLVSLSLFEAGARPPFQHSTRAFPVMLEFPFQQIDDFTLQLPAGLKIEDLPPAHKVDEQMGAYMIARERQPGGLLHVVRKMAMKQFYIPVDYYASLRAFFSKVKAGDDEQLVLQMAPGSEN